ncbi:MAG: RibD family protein [Pseudomonadota bacterium]
MADATDDLVPKRGGWPYRGAARDPCAAIRDWAGDGALVVAQLGQSLDGRIATSTGDSRWINQAAALTHLHRLRAAVDVVVVGAGTVRADNPRLNLRRAAGDTPARAVIDTRARLPDEGNWLHDDGARRIVIMADGVSPAPDSAAASARTERLVLHGDDKGRIAPGDIVDGLAKLGFRRILVEGGAWTVSHFLDADALDRLHLLVGPVIIGSGKTGLELAPIKQLSAARRPLADVIQLADGDVLFDCNLRETTEALDPAGG